MKQLNLIPLEERKKIDIQENNEPLVEIFETEKISLLSGHKYRSPFLRKTVLEKLIEASQILPSQYKLLVITAYRPRNMQKKLWHGRLRQMAKKHFFQMIFNHRKWKNIASKYTAPPGTSSHQCGAAIDVTVISEDGDRLDMGTSLNDFGHRVNTFSDLITDEQNENRMILYNAMTKAGFINYPLEWWHFSYGDQMWAAYNNLKNCMYGPLNK